MESIVLIAEILICVALVAAIRQGMRRKSEAMISLALLSMIIAEIVLMAFVNSDTSRRDLQSHQTPMNPDVGRLAMEMRFQEWLKGNFEDGTIICVWPPESEAADATTPENRRNP